ncbi:MAG: tRNA (adenosine(37)-N6)-threonylcarbamoyltransferase complex ATPase subunit type 1 TsaE [Bacteroidetes bacterium]|nr:tRNA (adenosine(37)-N6)-threonylcarbamoyltransferase complex ATPase subunit type 1 TsaE [Bacteroidota bacterium]
MELPLVKECTLEVETRELAQEFALLLKPGDVVALNGNLGSGKTFFVNSICKKFGVNFVSSPTFSIVNEYEGEVKIYHFDFYRIENPLELYDIGFEEYLNDLESIIFIEWAGMIPGVLPNSRYEVNFDFIDQQTRRINIRKYE